MRFSIRRMATILTTVAIMVSAMVFHVSADGDKTISSSTIYSSLSCTAGEYKNDPFHTLQATMPVGVYGGDVGIWFYDTSVGLQASFIKTTERRVYMECREADTVSSTLGRIYLAGFGVKQGLYKPVGFTYYSPENVLMEEDGNLELYMRFMIEEYAGDTSRAVPTGILRYRFWAYTE